MTTVSPHPARTEKPWVRIPDGTMVRHRQEGHDGIIDGLTEFVSGPERNPDGKTQYRLNVGSPTRQLVTEHDLSILLDKENLIIMARQKEPYRRSVTAHLRSAFADDRFVRSA
ncbi:MAG: hypothetical protein RI101_05090 [Nitrospira sp.]|jgi:hypothetical protein|nr:hypothetical protein [Nitrospira sp.]